MQCGGYGQGLAISPDGKLVAVGTSLAKVVIWDWEEGNELAAFEAHGKEVNSIRFSGDSRMLVTASGDKTVKLWKLRREGD